MHSYIPIWKQAPLLRVVMAFIIGILLQYYCELSTDLLRWILLFSFCNILLINKLSISLRIHLRHTQSVLLLCAIIICGMIAYTQNDHRIQQDWYGNMFNVDDALIGRIDEPLTEKANSYKSMLHISYVMHAKQIKPCFGKMLVYFKKDSSLRKLQYGDLLLLNKKMQPIKNLGNPGAFDNARYQAFQHTHHQVYLTKSDFVLLPQKDINSIQHFIFNLKDYTLQCLQKWLPKKDGILGIAEALLIGYKNDLDKEMVQSYSDAGVVHIIAISGLHLGLIYGLLSWLLNHLPWIKKSRLSKAMILIFCLWIFSLVTGASASVLRSAVMFTCIIIGDALKRKSVVYNSLAASAFILLCYNPYLLWDVGFQLSYLAIIGIVWLQKPIQKKLSSNNWLLHKLGEMLAITIAAQCITFPICIFYFHQFPNLFLLTNMIAVPLSTFILFAEIFLLIATGIPVIASTVAHLVEWSIGLMNESMLYCNRIPFAIWKPIFATATTTVLLYIVVIGFCGYCILASKSFLKWALMALLFFNGMQAYLSIYFLQQKKIVIYHTPKKQSIDFIEGYRYHFIGDNQQINDASFERYFLLPTRMQWHAFFPGQLNGLNINNNWIQFYNQKLLIINKATPIAHFKNTGNVDVLLLSKNPLVNFAELNQSFRPGCIVFDATNSLWKIAKWKKECDALHLRYFSIPDQGAFVMNL